MNERESQSRERSIEVSWIGGGSGAIMETDGNFVVAESDTAKAPGTPLAATATHDGHTRYEIKVRGCKRISEAPVRFRIEGRFVNLSAKNREAILTYLKGA